MVATIMWAGISIATLWTVYTNIVTISSHLHSLLPPWDNDAIAQFPTLQKYYHLFIVFLGYAGASYRSTTYQSISTKDGQQPSSNAVKSTGGSV